MHVSEVLADLLDEQAALDKVISQLTDNQWVVATASPRWDVTDQVAHLTYFDHAAATAIRDEADFAALVKALRASSADGAIGVDAHTLDPVRNLAVGQRLGAWRAGRDELADAAAGLRDDARVPWYGPSMGAKSFLTARLMECWAHGQDIVDAVGADRPATDRLRHIAQLGVITRGWTYANRKLEMPTDEVHVSLQSPSGVTWTWGPVDAENSVAGSAEDFCGVVTQRRRLQDTGLSVAGEAALDWMMMAQAFAGPPTTGPER
ncbi:MAG: TIGR03084 family protein [Acidimicrobiaceae bacterium]|nr:TIGR03084 family metal-binding protein [Acidimicrobiaceae bacterium]MXW60913.1 TIGR03084 family protein [Acidimicrobiaceae bacterium]MXW75030.1 TIGR03084 family protein [Acidimicrobiaceae bacterium]MYC42532.1 TIGR03084 family protein [Acidimicrobiaceae bacterium]MYD07553.1 TIGR03084 family protein [Acidimicrobiaceae bacterium]